MRGGREKSCGFETRRREGNKSPSGMKMMFEKESGSFFGVKLLFHQPREKK